jgi:hypothetical protein
MLDPASIASRDQKLDEHAAKSLRVGIVDDSAHG